MVWLYFERGEPYTLQYIIVKCLMTNAFFFYFICGFFWIFFILLTHAFARMTFRRFVWHVAYT